MRALSVADTRDFGILRIIVSDIEKTKEVLSDDTLVTETKVITVRMDDKAGALRNVLKVLQDGNINIEYVYAFTGGKTGSAYVVLRVNEVEDAEKVLEANGIKSLNDADFDDILA